MMETLERFRGCLLGLAAGDAVGAPVEFMFRGEFDPVTGMRGGGHHELEPGQWTDDTSMALCLGASLVECGKFDAADQMERYLRWVREGYFSCTGQCFDIGATTSAALARYVETGEPFAGSDDPWSAGNGSIMRLAAVPMFYFPDHETAAAYAALSSRTTHGAAQCVDACRLMAGMIVRALEGRGKEEILLGDADFKGDDRIAGIARGEYRDKDAGSIQGSGYVVESLEAALWCFHRTGTFREAVLDAANLGDDSDTTAAVCGQVAGAFYGASGIPGEWLEPLAMREEITALADLLHEMSGAARA